MTRFTPLFIFFLTISQVHSQNYLMPAETEPHEGTWLQWPHQYEYGVAFRNSLDPTWVAMTAALVQSEKVHIIAYNATEQIRITNLLAAASVDMTNVDFKLFPTNDVWVRDNGPIFVRNSSGNLVIEDWGFNGWGGDYNFDLCDPIPTSVANELSMPLVDLNSTMIIEGGSFELDGTGVFLATRSSILSQSNSNGALSIRNPGMTQAQAEAILTQFIGTTKYIWLNGFLSPDDITDAHIDGFARFANETTLVTMSNANLAYWGLSSADISTLNAASDVNNNVYTKVLLPLTQNNVSTTSGFNLGYKGSYCNYYIANTVVLVPNYNDPNDAVANAIIQGIHPDKTVFGIDCRNLYEYGGMVHCVTQQQPVANATNNVDALEEGKIEVGRNYPNPTSGTCYVDLTLIEADNIQIVVYNALGTVVWQNESANCTAGEHHIKIDLAELANGVYTYQVMRDEKIAKSGRLVVSK